MVRRMRYSEIKYALSIYIFFFREVWNRFQAHADASLMQDGQAQLACYGLRKLNSFDCNFLIDKS